MEEGEGEEEGRELGGVVSGYMLELRSLHTTAKMVVPSQATKQLASSFGHVTRVGLSYRVGGRHKPREVCNHLLKMFLLLPQASGRTTQ